jgi:hypothetical protein
VKTIWAGKRPERAIPETAELKKAAALAKMILETTEAWKAAMARAAKAVKI